MYRSAQSNLSAGFLLFIASALQGIGVSAASISFETVVGSGQLVASEPMWQHGYFSDAVINESGSVAWIGSADEVGDGPWDEPPYRRQFEAVFVDGNIVFREGPAPGGGKITGYFGECCFEEMGAFSGLAMNNVGDVAVRVWLAETDLQKAGLVGQRSAAISTQGLLARTDDPVPGRPEAFFNLDGVIYNMFTPRTPFSPITLADSGETVFSTTMIGPQRIEANNYESDVAVSSKRGVLLESGDPAPFIPGARIVSINAWVNARGETFFEVSLKGDSVTSENNRALIGPDGVIARKGDPISDLPGATLSGYFEYLGVDSTFSALYYDQTGKNARGVFVDGRLVISRGAPIPGYPAFSAESFLIAESGEVVVLGRGDTELPGLLSDAVVFVIGRDGVARPIVKTGQNFAVSGDSTLRRPISDLGLADANGRGQILFGASFDDGSSALIRADIAAVPLPPTWLLSVAAFSALWRSRRRTRSLVTQAA